MLQIWSFNITSQINTNRNKSNNLQQSVLSLPGGSRREVISSFFRTLCHVFTVNFFPYIKQNIISFRFNVSNITKRYSYEVIMLFYYVKFLLFQKFNAYLCTSMKIWPIIKINVYFLYKFTKKEKALQKTYINQCTNNYLLLYNAEETH